MHKIFLVQKRILRIMLGLGPRCSCRSWFVKLYILPVTSLYIFLLIMFICDNPDNFKTNLLIHNFNTRSKNHYIFQLFMLPLYGKVLHIVLRIINALPNDLLQLQNNKALIKSMLRKYLLVNAFHSVDEFLVH
jgi:hypothetical protein